VTPEFDSAIGRPREGVKYNQTTALSVESPCFSGKLDFFSGKVTSFKIICQALNNRRQKAKGKQKLRLPA
jgi:hypothetical protein